MSVETELRLFHVVVGGILLIPIAAGLAGALGGIDGLSALFFVDDGSVVPPATRNNLRAICWMFFMLVPLVIWLLRDLEGRATGFRIVVGFGAAAGFVRLLGRAVDGAPGVIPTIICGIELAVLPLVLVWHARLIRRRRMAA